MTNPELPAVAFAAALLMAGAALADASKMYGTWVPVGEQCELDGMVNSAGLTVGQYGVAYFEHRCDTLEAPLASEDGTSLTYALSCDNGVDTWNQTTVFTLSPDDQLTIMNVDGAGFAAQRCP